MDGGRGQRHMAVNVVFMIGESHATPTKLKRELNLLHCRTSMANVRFKSAAQRILCAHFFHAVFWMKTKCYFFGVEGLLFISQDVFFRGKLIQPHQAGNDGNGSKLTKAFIEDACQRARVSSRHSLPNEMGDSGTQNLNWHVDALVKSGLIKRTIAKIDIGFSNSMIES
jgi:hypothetical protein